MMFDNLDVDKAIKYAGEERYEEAMEKVAIAMKEKGYDIGAIAEVTELPIETILQL